MNVVQLSQQLNQLSESLRSTNALTNKLSELNFQPGSEPLDSENAVRVELAQDIHDSLKQLEEELELLKQEAEDLKTIAGHGRRRDSERDGERARCSAQVARVDEDLRQSRSRFRRAQLAAKRASEAAKQKERELVFASLQSAPDRSTTGANGSTQDLFAGRRKQQQKQLTKEALLIQSSSDVTAALRRTHSLLSTEVDRSHFARETLEESTAALRDLEERYSSLDEILSNSRNLLGALFRSQKSDTWYLETAFYILIATICWLFFRRLLYGPFIKLPLFLWRVLAFVGKWVILQPLFFLLSAVGVIKTYPAGESGHSTAIATSRTPLIVQPSATGKPIPVMMEDRRGGGVPVGAGGAGAKAGPDAALQGQMSESIAQMAQQSSQHDPQASHTSSEQELPKRADGTVLQERGDIPANPKKKMMFEADVEDAKHEARKKDEL